MLRRRLGTLALAILALASNPLSAAGQAAPADSVRLSLRQALDMGLARNPRVVAAAYNRAAAGAAKWDAYGNFLPRVNLQGQLQRAQQGTFVVFGREFTSPATYSTVYQWDFSHSLLDSGRDLFRLKSARAGVDRAIAGYDLQSLQTATQIETQYLEARRRQALIAQAQAQVDLRRKQLDLAQARYDVGAVTKSDVLLAELEANRGDVAVLQARQQLEEARLALRRLLGGELPAGPLTLTTSFQVFEPAYDVDRLVSDALNGHPSLRDARAQRAADEANLWIARSSYLPSLQFQYSLSRSAVDTNSFQYSGFDKSGFASLSLNWQLFGGFSRYNQTSQANAALQSARAEERTLELQVEQDVRTAYGRLVTAYASHRAARLSVDLAAEDLRLGEGRYRTGTGSFVDLVDARTRASQAETDLITATYDFYLALVQLESATGLILIPDEVSQP